VIVYLAREKAKALELINGKGFTYKIDENAEYYIEYPVIAYPER